MTSEKVTVSTVTENKVQTERKATKTLGKVRNVGRISSKNEITFKIWNIHGLKSSNINAIKNKSDSFLNNIFNDSDFVTFTEAWSDKGDGDLFLWDDDFEEKFCELGLRNSRGGRSSGGISFCASKVLDCGYKILSSRAYRTWCRLDRSLFEWDQNITICFLYIPPSDSNWFKSGKSFNFDKLREETAQYELMGNVILCGDFNGRIGLNSDFVENDEKDEFLPLPKDYEPANVDLINLKSRDPQHDLEGNGRALLEFCRMSGFQVANGRIGKDQSEENITCYNTKGNSIVDYLLRRKKISLK